MSRRQRAPWFGGNTTLAGAFVTVTSCAVTAGTAATGCVLMIQGKVNDGREALLQAGAFLATTVALLSRTRQDPAATIEQPATVTASTTETPADVSA